ncbi:hypothetical protein X727_15495 [Mesorhizobium sp. L103C119B0]|uniref:hypothetical protein n=1 Tax=unclassified Mesorhizobium TaxID=325217 RepID=UPI0003D033CA|nr:hypothetical protein X727_15495 [Mesorhizobium sp. L103C119B0]
MVATPIEIAQAATATTATLLKWQKSMEERATFRQNMDQSRRAIQASRDLLKRLRQRHRDDMAESWEDADPSPAASARRPEPM